jgi:hypothetical protein
MLYVLCSVAHGMAGARCQQDPMLSDYNDEWMIFSHRRI